jgi:hypothetical protein
MTTLPPGTRCEWLNQIEITFIILFYIVHGARYQHTHGLLKMDFISKEKNICSMGPVSQKNLRVNFHFALL